MVTVSKLCDDTAEDDSASASTLQHLTFKDAISTEIENGKSLKELKEPLLPISSYEKITTVTHKQLFIKVHVHAQKSP